MIVPTAREQAALDGALTSHCVALSRPQLAAIPAGYVASEPARWDRATVGCAESPDSVC